MHKQLHIFPYILYSHAFAFSFWNVCYRVMKKTLLLLLIIIIIIVIIIVMLKIPVGKQIYYSQRSTIILFFGGGGSCTPFGTCFSFHYKLKVIKLFSNFKITLV